MPIGDAMSIGDDKPGPIGPGTPAVDAIPGMLGRTPPARGPPIVGPAMCCGSTPPIDGSDAALGPLGNGCIDGAPTDEPTAAPPPVSRTSIVKSPIKILSPSSITRGPVIFSPLTNVPFVLLRSITMIFPSLTTIRECRFEIFDLPRTISLPLIRPMRTSDLVLSNVCTDDGPSFSVMVTLSI